MSVCSPQMPTQRQFRVSVRQGSSKPELSQINRQDSALRRLALTGSNTNSALHSLEIRRIRKDGQTQHRAALGSAAIKLYAALMAQGAEFPPVTVWLEGSNYWLTDGFHRIAAAEQLGCTYINALIRVGTLSDAQWDSYAANSLHGLRRKQEDIQAVISAALRHPKAAKVSNVELARHLNLPEATLRRWLKRLSSSHDEDSFRLVKRGQTTYSLCTANIGKHLSQKRHLKSLKELRAELSVMKGIASPDTRRFIVIFANWAVGTATATECVEAIERVVKEYKP